MALWHRERYFDGEEGGIERVVGGFFYLEKATTYIHTTEQQLTTTTTDSSLRTKQDFSTYKKNFFKIK